MKAPASPIRVPTSDGWAVHLEPHLPKGSPRAALLLGPGMMLDRRAMDRPRGRGMASFFRDRGFAAYTLDPRGKGAGGPKAADGGNWTYDDLVLRDLPAALRELAARHPDVPSLLVGHSLSSHVGAASVGIHPDLPVDGLVLLAPVVWIRRHEPSRLHWLAKRMTLTAWHAVARAVGYFPARRLRIGTEDEPLGYVSQFTDWARANRWGHRSGAPDYLAALGRIEQPVLVMSGERDRIARPTSVERFARAVGARGAPHRTVPGAGHMDLIDGRRCRDAWEGIATWIEEVQLSVRTR